VAKARGDGSTIRVGVDGGLTLYNAVYDMTGRGFPTNLKYELVPLIFGPMGVFKYAATVVANLLASKLASVGLTVELQDAFATKADSGRSNRKGGNGTKVHFTITVHNRAVVSHLDLLFVGIGSNRAGLFQREMQLSPKQPHFTREYFGDILNLPFDRNGDEVASLARSRATLLNLNELQEIAMSSSALVVGSAGGTDKIDAIRAVLMRKYISVLITDTETARALLET
jgi:DNA-binding transcriptional regulator LsrR (DeoR family)